MQNDNTTVATLIASNISKDQILSLESSPSPLKKQALHEELLNFLKYAKSIPSTSIPAHLLRVDQKGGERTYVYQFDFSKDEHHLLFLTFRNASAGVDMAFAATPLRTRELPTKLQWVGLLATLMMLLLLRYWVRKRKTHSSL